MAADAATESVSFSGSTSGVGMFGMSTDELEQRMREGREQPGGSVEAGGGGAGGPGGPGGGGPGGGLAVAGRRGSEVSAAAEDAAAPWFWAAAGADSTSIGRTVRSITRSAIPPWTPRLMRS